ncbi:hypothetical protein [Microbacterium sp. cf332]|uniref:hypothetical protein n=1 Tax=Microbacterium sp. cf332 TaxID=1761804 RepID=UPI00089144A8|nr:hypothetical protein [Microbacterium sp. cf332]SDQ16104.1 hypothetical protein SAMN04487847_0664 [Microbacterium sp. cf332]
MHRTGTPSTPAALRTVGPPEAPFAGELVPGPSARSYRVVADDLPPGVWRADPDGHLLAATDLDRVDGRTIVALPRLTARLCGGEAALDLSPGQAVTLAVSALRGCVEAADAQWGEGEWWLTTAGRPVLVPVGDRSWGRSTIRLLERIPDTAIAPDLRALAVAAVDDTATLPFAVPTLEDELFAVATPAPLDSASPTPTGRGTRTAVQPAGEDDAARGAVADAARTAVHGLVDADILARVTAGLARTRPMASRAFAAVAAHVVRRRERRAPDRAPAPATRSSVDRSSSHPRRRLIVVAGSALAVTLGLGLLWPDGAPAPSPSATGGRVIAGTPRADDAGGGDELDRGERAETPVEVGDTVSHDDPEMMSDADESDGSRADRHLLDELASCLSSTEGACRAAVLERPDAPLPKGAATVAASREVTLVDDLGGVRVVRVSDSAGRYADQIVVIVAHDDERLVRDVYDVADQP